MKNETIHEHAKRIEILNELCETIANDEGIAFEDLGETFIVWAAGELLRDADDEDLSWTNNEEERAVQKFKLRDFINKWGSK